MDIKLTAAKLIVSTQKINKIVANSVNELTRVQLIGFGKGYVKRHQLQLNFTDILTFSEIFDKLSENIILESVSINDLLTHVMNKSEGDYTELFEDISIVATFNRPIIEVISPLELITLSSSYHRAFIDTIAIYDAFGTFKGAKNIDSFSITEDLSLDISKNAYDIDVATLYEAVILYSGFLRDYYDVVAIEDTLSKNINKNINDSTNTSEDLTALTSNYFTTDYVDNTYCGISFNLQV